MLVVVVVGCGGDARKEESRPQPEVTVVGVGGGELVDVGGRRLYVECIGSGSPTVLLEAGLGLASQSWTTVQLELGQTTRTCAYDRAGMGDSDAMPGVHDAGDEIRDLERLLTRGRIAPPYVLVGHSYGGLLARLFARAHPEQVAGVEFVDASGYDATRRQLAIWPRSQAPARRRDWAKPVQFGVDLNGSDALESELRRLGDTPVVAVTGARTWTEFWRAYRLVSPERNSACGACCTPSSPACRPITSTSLRSAVITLSWTRNPRWSPTGSRPSSALSATRRSCLPVSVCSLARTSAASASSNILDRPQRR